MTDPTKARCWDKEWTYVRSESTDIRKRFDAVRQQLSKQTKSTVRPLRKKEQS